MEAIATFDEEKGEGKRDLRGKGKKHAVNFIGKGKREEKGEGLTAPCPLEKGKGFLCQ